MSTEQSKSSRKRTWPNVYNRTQRGGQVSYVVDLGLINDKRERHSFKTKAEAKTFAELKRTERSNQGVAALTLTSELRTAATKAAAILEPHGVGLVEAAEYYRDHVIAYRTSPTLDQLIDRMIAEAEQNDRRERTVEDLKNRLEAFAEEFPGNRLSDLTVADIRGWFDENDDWSPRTRINYLTKLSQLYNYALKHNWVDANLVERIDRPSTEDKEPEIFTVDQARRLLLHADDFGLLPYIALGLFAGLRSAELMRLDGKALKFQDKAIVVGVNVAKKRSRRVVDMCEALEEWLTPCLPLKGAIVDSKEFRDNLKQLREAAGITTWPANGLRHSFGSYHLAFHGDAIKTANQMGHRSSDIVHNHYKALVLKADAEAYWNLKPETKPTDEKAATTSPAKKSEPLPPAEPTNADIS